MKKQNLKVKFKKSKSFTLIEVITAVFLGAIIIMAAYSVYQISYKSYKKSSANAELTQNARIALERMSREIRQAQEIVTVMPQTPTPAASEIKFQDGHNIMASPAPSCSIQYLSYSLSGSDLHRILYHYSFGADPTCVKYNALDDSQPPQSPTIHIDSDEVKAQQLSGLEFYGTQKTVTIHFSVTDGQSTYQFETKVTARNAS